MKKIIVLLTCVLAAPIAWADKYPDATVEGMPRVESKNLDAVYWRDDAELSGYTKVMIDPCQVSFRKNWQRDQNRTRGPGRRVETDDMERIRTQLSERFNVIFTEALQEDNGYEVVTTAGDDVLLLRPQIVDLDIFAPDIMEPGTVRTFTTEAGRMTLQMDLIDSSTQAVLGRVIDRKRARQNVGGVRTNSVTNRAEGDRMLRRWARLLKQALDDAR